MKTELIPIIVDFLIYGLIIFTIAIVANRRTKNLNDYVLGGRCFSGPITALSAGASDMSGWLLMALPGGVYLNGLSMIWMPVALVLGAYCNWKFVASRLRIYTEVASDSLTLPEFLCNRFKRKCLILRMVTASVIAIFFIFYMVSGFVAGAELTKMAFNLDYKTALLLSAGVIIVYTTIGGFLAVNWIDFFQGILMFVALIAVPLVTYFSSDSFNVTLLKEISPGYLNPFAGISCLGLLSLFAWGLGYFGQPHINVRFMAIRNVLELSVARRICMVWMVLSLLGAILTGVAGFWFFRQQPLAQAETVFIVLSRELLNPWLTGIMYSAILSAVMSTVSAMILMIASILVEDIYKAFIRKHARNSEYLLVGKICLLLVATLPLAIASNSAITIFQTVGFAWSGLGAAFGPTILFSIFWRNMTKSAAIMGIIVGALTVLIWGWLRSCNIAFFIHPEFLPGIELLPGFIFSSLAIVITSKFSAKPSTEVLAEFEQMLSREKAVLAAK